MIPQRGIFYKYTVGDIFSPMNDDQNMELIRTSNSGMDACKWRKDKNVHGEEFSIDADSGIDRDADADADADAGNCTQSCWSSQCFSQFKLKLTGPQNIKLFLDLWLFQNWSQNCGHFNPNQKYNINVKGRKR